MSSLLSRLGLENSPWVDPIVAAAIFAIAVVAALLFNRGLFPVVVRLTSLTPSDLDTRLVRATRLPLTLAILVLGAYLAVVVPLTLTEEQLDSVNRAAKVLAVVVGVIGAALLSSSVFGWYLERVAPMTRSNADQRLFPLLRRVTVGLVYGLGALVVLDLLNINISPLIAGLGLGGLAVALALQPTLSNLFAGTYVMTEGVITPGDYIEMENGIAGYVVDVGWRSTRIRTFYNNLVVVPNSRFAETIITNYQEPSPPVNVIVDCGVSYDSDLYRVEEVCREVMDEVLEEDPNGVKEYGSWFGFDKFDESNVTFWLFIQAKDRLSSFGLRTALMQRLRQRFEEEGITINYPVRTLQFPREMMADDQKAPVMSRTRRNARSPRRRRRDAGRQVPAQQRAQRGVDLPPSMGQGGGEGEGGPSSI